VTDAEQCCKKGIGQWPPLALRDGGEPLPASIVLIYYCVLTLLINTNKMMYIFDMNGGKQRGVSSLVTMSNDKCTSSEAAKAPEGHM
jgi:hypothetical protein